MGRRRWTAEQKFAIVLQGIKGEIPNTRDLALQGSRYQPGASR
ncbi:hypothetical protein ACFL5L_04310 [candidate division KSB1 bacterium]